MRPVSVTQVTEYISKKLRDDYNLKGLVIEGEISGLSKSGQHYYLTLKDSESMLRCAIWGSNARNIDMSLVQNGKKVIVVADISPYAKGGSYSFSIRHVEAAGEGDLMAEFNRIKALLEKEGLFDQKHKKPIPVFPERIGVITSSTGAAIEDIKKIITAKNNYTDILIFPTQVQGIGAVESIIENIILANELNRNGLHIDTLIVGRGGGSAEDLAAFNDEQLARTIFASDIPIISAVGHESDFSISDFVADVRAETPTAAANMAVMNTHELTEDIERCRKLLVDSVMLKIQAQRMLLDSRTEALYLNMKNKLNESRSLIEKAVIKLNENNPQNIFSKGYSAVLDGNGTIVSDINDIVIDDDYEIRLKNGSFKAKALDIERSK